MPKKPSKSHTVKLPWSLYVEVKNEAIERDITISEVLTEKVTMAKESAEDKTMDRKGVDNNSDSNFVCESCGAKFETKKELQGHCLGKKHGQLYGH